MSLHAAPHSTDTKKHIEAAAVRLKKAMQELDYLISRAHDLSNTPLKPHTPHSKPG